MSNRIPRIMIAGANSGAGKTTMALALVRGFMSRGLRVRAYKIGPDYLDPTYLALASGQACYNLDGWMMGRDYVRELFVSSAQDADISIIEGVMGLFDGADPDTIRGSSAEAAIWLSAPVILTVNAHGLARSLAPIVKGFTEFHSDLKLQGVFANHCGGQRHGEWLKKALEASGLPELVAAAPRGAAPELPSRHLGLVSANTDLLSHETLQGLQELAEKRLNLDRVLEIAHSAGPLLVEETGNKPRKGAMKSKERARIGVAMDEAFHFYYPDNLAALEEAGARLIFFSPTHDTFLPSDLDALYLGGGYPELYAKDLAANQSMLDQIRDFAKRGRPVYGECGGLMYMSRGIETLEGAYLEMAGVLPVKTHMLDRLQSLGYVEVELRIDSLFGEKGSIMRGHEFHYSRLERTPSLNDGWSSAYLARKRPGKGETLEGFQKGNLLLSYVHMHFASNLSACARFVELCGGRGN